NAPPTSTNGYRNLKEKFMASKWPRSWRWPAPSGAAASARRLDQQLPEHPRVNGQLVVSNLPRWAVTPVGASWKGLGRRAGLPPDHRHAVGAVDHGPRPVLSHRDLRHETYGTIAGLQLGTRGADVAVVKSDGCAFREHRRPGLKVLQHGFVIMPGIDEDELGLAPKWQLGSGHVGRLADELQPLPPRPNRPHRDPLREGHVQELLQ